MSYLNTDEAYEYNDLACWYQNSIDETQSPIWTDEHLEELLNDFYIIPKDTPTVDVVPKSEVAGEIFEEIERVGEIYENRAETVCYFPNGFLAELKKKYAESEGEE